MKVILHKQEVEGTYKFNGQVYMTKGFQLEFGDMAVLVALQTMALIRDRVIKGIADCLQVASFNGTRFWVIDDVSHITILLPSEY